MLYGSSEFSFGPGKGNNLDFLKALYNDVLAAPLDSQGQVTWGGQLAAGTSREAVALGVLTSQSADQVLVQHYYTAYLRRPADAGSATWVSTLQSGVRD